VSDFDITEGGWLPRRGDYNAHYADKLIPLVEATSCGLGCVRSGTDKARAEFGPGGDCDVLARMTTPERVTEIEPRPDGPVCNARQPAPAAGLPDQRVAS
jgi:hypothetical protein